MALIAIPFAGASTLARRWLLGEAGCQWYAFMMTWLAIGEIYLLTFIAIER